MIDEVNINIIVNTIVFIISFIKSPASWLFTQPFIQAQVKETPKLRVTGLCEGNSPVSDEFPTKGL